MRRSFAVVLVLGALGALSTQARADEFSPVSPDDPIYRQLRALDASDPTAVSVGPGLTRYEAALQVARIITRVSNDTSAQLSRVGWRALRDLSGSLRGELIQLGIDVAAAQKLADARLKAPEARPAVVTDSINAADYEGLGGASRAPSNLLPNLSRGAAGGSLLGGSPLLGSNSAFAPDLESSQFSAAILPRLRVGAALLAMQRAETDPFQRAGIGRALLGSGNGGRILGSDTSVDFDVNSWLSVNAQSSRRSLEGAPDAPPFLRSSLFDGASEARSAGGGVGIDIGDLSLTTGISRLSTDTGARGTSLDSGVRFSAWQNRLLLSAHMARLQPEDRAVVPLTKTELNIQANVSQRLSLSLFYQGLFTQQNASSERVAGGLNLRF